MKEISYVIWGICDQFGYKESISTSFDNNLVPQNSKKATPLVMKMVEFLLHFQMRILIKITFFNRES